MTEKELNILTEYQQKYKNISESKKKLNNEADTILTDILTGRPNHRIDFAMYDEDQDRYNAGVTEGEKFEVLFDALTSSSVALRFTHSDDYWGVGAIKSLVLVDGGLQIAVVDIADKKEYVLNIDNIESYENLIVFALAFA